MFDKYSCFTKTHIGRLSVGYAKHEKKRKVILITFRLLSPTIKLFNIFVFIEFRFIGFMPFMIQYEKATKEKQKHEWNISQVS